MKYSNSRRRRGTIWREEKDLEKGYVGTWGNEMRFELPRKRGEARFPKSFGMEKR